MMQTIEAIIDEKGRIHPLEEVELKNVRRAFVTLLPALSEDNETFDTIQRLGEILDEDLEGASREIAQSFGNALEKSAKELVDQA